MTDEDRQRTMDFILEQQAQFSVNVQKLEEIQKQAELERKADAVRIGRVEESIITLTRIAQGFDERLDNQQEQITDVKQAVVMLAKIVGEGRNGQS
ncbi:MAG: hypothetical protein H7Y30_02730 [Pyrinomonadaceae bacterium]|nr:hypothetical protein [Pyrinomonadaceae bacterium]